MLVSHTAAPGGAERYLADLVRGAEPWEAAFLGDGPVAEELSSSGAPVVVLRGGDRLQSIGQGTSWRAGAAAIADLVRASLRIARIAREYDVLVANSQKSLPVLVAAGVLARRPVVWVLHDLMTDPAFSTVNRRVAVALSRCVRVVGVNSRATGAAFVAVGGQAAKVRVVPNGFDTDVPDPGPDHGRALRELVGLDERPVVGLFGRLAPWKGQDVLLRALPSLPDVQAVLVGGPLFGADDVERDLRALVDSLGLADRVRFLGHREDVPTLMAGVDVVVHCSTVPEPFGRVLVEAHLARRPLVATDGGGVREIVTDGVDGLVVPPGDPHALTASVRRLLADRDLGQRLADAGRGRSAGRYGLPAARSAFQNLVEEATARS